MVDHKMEDKRDYENSKKYPNRYNMKELRSNYKHTNGPIKEHQNPYWEGKKE